MWLGQHLQDLFKARLPDDFECVHSVVMQVILIECDKYLQEKLGVLDNEAAPITPYTSLKTDPNDACIKSEKLLELNIAQPPSISIEVPNVSNPNIKVLMSGQADWTFRYTSKAEDRPSFAAVVARKRLNRTSEKHN